MNELVWHRGAVSIVAFPGPSIRESADFLLAAGNYFINPHLLMCKFGEPMIDVLYVNQIHKETKDTEAFVWKCPKGIAIRHLPEKSGQYYPAFYSHKGASDFDVTEFIMRIDKELHLSVWEQGAEIVWR